MTDTDNCCERNKTVKVCDYLISFRRIHLKLRLFTKLNAKERLTLAIENKWRQSNCDVIKLPRTCNVKGKDTISQIHWTTKVNSGFLFFQELLMPLRSLILPWSRYIPDTITFI
jgi:hypothetical protein